MSEKDLGFRKRYALYFYNYHLQRLFGVQVYKGYTCDNVFLGGARADLTSACNLPLHPLPHCEAVSDRVIHLGPAELFTRVVPYSLLQGMYGQQA